jgi:Methyltransferase domain
MLRLGQAHARHQQKINRGLLDLIAEVSARNHALTEMTTHLAQRVDALEGRLPPLEALAGEIRAVPDPHAIGLERFEADGVGRVIGYRHAAPAVSPEDAYVAFEDVFRLSEDVIRERQRPYLRLLNGRQPVLDAGAGRGEFLELLRDAGVAARGVDLDDGMVARARAKGLDIEQGDLIAYLDHCPDASLGVVFAAQVVEHLQYVHLLAFLRLALAKLQPGGLLIAETVNPHAPGALKRFWIDPTHQHPIFPEVLLTLCRGVGFRCAYVFHPGGSGDVDADREVVGDYAVVAKRASEAGHDDQG